MFVYKQSIFPRPHPFPVQLLFEARRAPLRTVTVLPHTPDTPSFPVELRILCTVQTLLNTFRQQDHMRNGEVGIGVVVVIALGLLVLVILAILLGSQFGNLDDQLSSCEAQRGQCTTRSACLQAGGQVISGASCTQDVVHEYTGGWGAITFPVGGSTCCVTQ